jgi:hypothetical protein
MYNWLKISHHSHSGRLRPHEYTSYIPLILLLIVVGATLAIGSVMALHPPPQAGSIGLSGSMPGIPPKTAATITSPDNQQHFGSSPVTVKGTCPKQTLVEVYKNDIFAGSGSCSDAGTFSFDVDLLFGQNTLMARVYDALNQAGPDSNRVIVFYDALPAQGASLSSLNFGGTQLILNTDAVYRGMFPGQAFNIPIDILGGSPPYAVNIQWGDSTNKIVPRNDNLTFNTAHTYDKPGIYQISLQGTDSQGRVAFLTVASIVNGQPVVNIASAASKSPINKLLILWPLYASAFAVVISFLMGERREKRILGPPPALIFHPQG